MQAILFIDRDGTILQEPEDEQIDKLEKFRFVPNVIHTLRFLRQHTDYLFVMVSNQDGLGTLSFPEEDFWPLQNLMLHTLESEGVVFDDILIDRSFPEDNAPTRKPRIGLLTKYLNGNYDIAHSFVIGDRETDVQLAQNIGCEALLVGEDQDWNKIAARVFAGQRTADCHRQTKETDIHVSLNIDGTGKADIQTGLGFFDHMLEQIARHGNIDLTIHAKGDLNVDEHHTIEDTAIVLGNCLREALGNKRGIERYGFTLPMDDCQTSVVLDFGGRPWLVWNTEFHRERIGDVPTEMFLHFFKSLSDAAQMNLQVTAEGENEHHKIESIFKAFARSLRQAVHRDIYNYRLPSSKGTL